MSGDEREAANVPEAGPSTTPLQEGDVPLSKNAQKKLAKRARAQEHKLEKRAQERERRRARQHALSKGLAEGTLSPKELEHVERTRELKRARRAAAKGTEENVWPGAIVIDLGFDNLMTDNEITSMGSQLTYVYAANRTAKRPVATVLHTSFSPDTSPRLWDKMAKSQWQRWNRMFFWGEGLGTLAGAMKPGQEEEGGKGDAEAGDGANGKQDTKPPRPDTPSDVPSTAALSDPRIPFPASRQLVYLSADADEELSTLSEHEVYIIGGIVDRNRHKNLCQNKAEELGIRTARLPIGTFIDNLPTRKVLTVNQVYEILLNYLALEDWAAAFEAVIPQRKFFSSKDEKKQANDAKRAGSLSEGGGESDPGVGGEEEGAKVEEDEANGDETKAAESDDVQMYDEEAAMNG